MVGAGSGVTVGNSYIDALLQAVRFRLMKKIFEKQIRTSPGMVIAQLESIPKVSVTLIKIISFSFATMVTPEEHEPPTWRSYHACK